MFPATTLCIISFWLCWSHKGHFESLNVEKELKKNMYIPLSWDLEDVPLDGLVELGEVDPDVHDGTVLLLVSMPQVHLHCQCLSEHMLYFH